MADPNAQNALRHLQEMATFLRVLGSYPADASTL
jgi:arogenate/prephenate dehydratase